MSFDLWPFRGEPMPRPGYVRAVADVMRERLESARLHRGDDPIYTAPIEKRRASFLIACDVIRKAKRR